MAHYDCTNCGAPMGIAFGYCEKCTPKEYFEIKNKIAEIYAEERKEAITQSREKARRRATSLQKQLDDIRRMNDG